MIKDRNCVVFSTYGSKAKLIVKSKETSYYDGIGIILEYLKKIANDKNMFIHFYGDLNITDDSANIIRIVDSSENCFEHKIWVNYNWLNDPHNSLFEERYCDLYFFERDFKWDMFCKEKNIGVPRNSFPQLYLVASFSDGEFPCIQFGKKSILHSKLMLQLFIEKGYVVKRSFV